MTFRSELDMAPRRTSTPGRTTSFYRKNPKSYAKKLAAQKEINSRPEKKKYRAKLNAARRKAGIYGKGGPDMSHTKGGKLVKEHYKKNRARNGSGGNPRLKVG